MSCLPTKCHTCFELPQPINACADGLLIYFPEGTVDIYLISARDRIKSIHVSDYDTELGYVETILNRDLNNFLEQSKNIKVQFVDECGAKIEFAIQTLTYDCLNVSVSEWVQDGNTVIDAFGNCPPPYPTSI